MNERKICVITGAGRGIGRMTALYLAKYGYDLVLVSRSEPELQVTKDMIAQESPSVRTLLLPGDIADEKFAEEIFGRSMAHFHDYPRYLVNNAGLFIGKSIVDFATADWDQIFAVNVRGVYFLTRTLFQWHKEKGQGRKAAIVNVSSLAGIRGVEKFHGTSAYAASKSAVIGFTEASAVEGKPLHIRVNAVAPGTVATKMLADAAPFLKTSTLPEHIAPVIGYLLNDEQSGALNGSVIEIQSNER